MSVRVSSWLIEFVTAELDVPLRITRQMMMDSSHTPWLRDAYNSMDVVVAAGGMGLRVVGKDNEEVDEATLTPLQRRALERARQALGEAVTT